MFKFKTSFAAVTMAVASLASAQDTSSRSDLFNQMSGGMTGSSMTGDLPSSDTGRKIRITNTPSIDQGDPSARTGGMTNAARINSQRMNDDRDLQRQLGLGTSRDLLYDRAIKKEPSEFQKFIQDNTGKLLPIFGSEFFSHGLPTFAPVANAPVPSDYALGPGDELMIRGWGTIDIDYRATIDRNGSISIPTIGNVQLAGVRASEAQNVIRAAVGRLYKGVNVSVNLGQLRALTVYVVGQAKRPGTYTVSSLSTLVTALFASGGPNANGSMRHVQVKRGGKAVAELDLYAFIAKGDKSADIKLLDGDTIYIPPAGGFVGLMGKVNSPAVYELKSNTETIGSLLDFAGGLPVIADPRRAFLERIDPSRSHPRSVEEFALSSDGLQRPLKNGDVLNVVSITPDFSNAVVLRGNVDQQIRAPFKNGMRVSDLIPSKEYLVSRNSTRRLNAAVNDDDDANGDGEYGRTLRDGYSRDGRMRDGYSRDGKIRDGYSRDAKIRGGMIDDKDDSDMYSINSGQRNRNKLRKNTDDQTDTIAAHIGEVIDPINWDYAVVERVNRADLSVKLIPFNLGNVFSNPSGPDNIQLQPGDTVTVFSQDDVAVPMDKRQIFVRVEGEVNVPGVYQMNAGDTLQTLMAKAGGATANAYLFGTGFYREEVRKEQQLNLQRAADRLEAQVSSEQSSEMAAIRSMASADAAAAAAQLEAGRRLAEERIARFRKLQPTGRIAFGLGPNERSFAHLPRVALRNGDRLVIPSRPDFVHVFGAVNVEASPLWRPNSRVKDYLKLSGTTSDADIDNVFVLRVDGTVVSADSDSWFFGKIGGLEIMPGDTIVVPEKLDKTTFWSAFTKGARDWTQILANLGLGAAAIKTLKQ